jgi:cytochrome c2
MLIALIGLYGPYAMFRVKPFEGAATVKAPAGTTSHAAPAKTETLPPETPFERQVRAETYKWCTFCHTMNKGGAHIAGPNLYGIYGQRIATVPNFTYSDALGNRGKRGEIWDDRALDAYLANPDSFAPGTTMVISSGNITDPRRRAAIITILKRETGSDAAPASNK